MKGQAGSERKCRIRSRRETKVRKNNLSVRKSTVERMMSGEQSARVKSMLLPISTTLGSTSGLFLLVF